MRRSQRRKTVAAYVADRLSKECKRRGVAAEIARSVHFTRVHVAAVARGDNAAGDDFIEAMAKHWGMTREELEEEAAHWADENGVDVAEEPKKAGRLRERAEWGSAVSAAKTVFRGVPDVYFDRVGMIVDDDQIPQRIDALFVGEMAKILYDLAVREERDPPESSSAHVRTSIVHTTKKASKQ